VDDALAGVRAEDRCRLGGVFDEVPEVYDRVRPTYPAALFADLAAITGVEPDSAVLEVGCGTGQATRDLVQRGYAVTAVEPGAGMAALARERLAAAGQVEIETSAFERWEDRGRRYELVLAASSWHWVDPSVGWPAAHRALRAGGWFAILENVVVRRKGEPEVYARTADLHELFAPGDADWGDPPLESEVRSRDVGWGPAVEDPGALFGAPVVRCHPWVKRFDGKGFADLLRATSIYRKLRPEAREPLLDAIAERIRTEMGDLAPRRYLSFLRVGRRAP
jgi:SAM-dependent methyltransferase